MPHGLRAVVAALAELAHRSEVDKVAGIEARGFLLAAPVGGSGRRRAGAGAQGRQAARVDTRRVDYALEYGTATLEIQAGRCRAGRPGAGHRRRAGDRRHRARRPRPAREAGAVVSGLAVLLELAALGGRAQLEPLPVCPLLVV